MDKNKEIHIQNLIYEVRGQKVIFDSDLAGLYQVEVKALNRAVKRNIKRFPNDFMFQVAITEWENLKRHFGTSSWGGKRKLPYVFTEQGIAMLSGLLNSDVAINVNIRIMRAFIQLRHHAFLQNNTNEPIVELRKLLLLHIENNDYKFLEYDEAIKQIVIALNNLIEKPKETKTIGFRPNKG